MSENSNQNYVFVLGREQKLALAELESVLNRFCFSFSASASAKRDGDIFRITRNLAFANIDNFTDNDAKSLIQVLGGTIKAFRLVNSKSEIQITKQALNKKFQNDNSKTMSSYGSTRVSSSLEDAIADILLSERGKAENKIDFGISDYTGKYSRQVVNSIGIGAKRALKNRMKLRFVEAKEGGELSSIVSLKNDLDSKGMEIGIFEEALGVLVGLSNPEEWNKRDYGKPVSDKFSGMVPPKLARMMVNLALGELTGDSSRCLVVDPFCGSGNILMEAMMVGCDVIGSDISEKAVRDTKTNLGWLNEQVTNSHKFTKDANGSVILSEAKDLRDSSPRQFGVQNDNMSNISEYEVFQADATSEELVQSLFKLDNFQLSTRNNCLAIVSEPYLGRPKKYKPTYREASSEYEPIRKMYLDFLTNIAPLLHGSIAGTTNNETMKQSNNGVVSLIFPLVETSDGKNYNLLRESVDELNKLGYTEIRTPMVYGRDY